MIRSLLVRNALSALLLLVALGGVAVQVRLIRLGFVQPQTRLELAGYLLIAIYAAASIAVRWRAMTAKK